MKVDFNQNKVRKLKNVELSENKDWNDDLGGPCGICSFFKAFPVELHTFRCGYSLHYHPFPYQSVYYPCKLNSESGQGDS